MGACALWMALDGVLELSVWAELSGRVNVRETGRDWAGDWAGLGGSGWRLGESGWRLGGSEWRLGGSGWRLGESGRECVRD